MNVGVIKKLCNRARKLGADDAVVINPKQVETAEWVRLKCKYGCSGYAGTLCCPPYSPTPAQTRQVLDGYSKGILIHKRGEGTRQITVELEGEAFLSGFYKAYSMGSGPCRLCRSACSFEEGCRHPEKARPSMEASGIDVFATVRKHKLPIEVVTDYEQEADFYGLVLLE
jgi:predicted metal-binding protein